MMFHSYPLLISIYKGEGRMLIVPLIDHIAGYSIDSDWFISLSDLDNAVSVGEGVKSALDYIRNSPLFRQGTLSEIFHTLSENQYVINLLSKDYLQNEEIHYFFHR